MALERRTIMTMTASTLLALAGVVALSGCATPDVDAAVRQCVGAGFVVEDGFNGEAEEAVSADIVAGGREVRVLGRDGGCEDRNDDRNLERVNLYVYGLVVWAGVG